MPMVSVVVPVYKVEEYLSRCVESILNQTFKDFELILVDDGSPDSCGKICDEYASMDSRIIVIHKKNGGLSDARNAGIDWTFDNSDSEWITFIDSDDWIHPQYLEILYNAVRQTNTLISVGSYMRTPDMVDFWKNNMSNINLFDTSDFFMNHTINAVVAWGKLYNKSLFRDVRYPVGKIHEDEFTTHKLLFQCDKIVFIDQSLYYYYINDDSIMQSQVWTPNYLDSVDGIEEQIKYFSNRQLKNLKSYSIKRLEKMIIYNINLLEKSKKKGYIKADRFIRYLRNKLKKILIIYRNCENYSINKDTLVFEYAYPKLMVLYWKFKSIFDK